MLFFHASSFYKQINLNRFIYYIRINIVTGLFQVYEGIAKNIEKGKPETRCAVKTVNEHATDRWVTFILTIVKCLMVQ